MKNPNSEPPGKIARVPLKTRHVANVAFVYPKTEEIILHGRMKKKYAKQVFRTFFGGRRDSGEIPIQAAIREIWEEIGMKLTPDQLIHVCRTKVEKILSEAEKDSLGAEREIIVRDVFLVLTKAKIAKFRSKENKGDDGAPFSFNEALALPFRNDIRDEIRKVEGAVQKTLHKKKSKKVSDEKKKSRTKKPYKKN